MIKEIIIDSDIKNCVSVIKKSFKTVADEYNLKKENASTNPAFITFEKLKQSIIQGTKLFGLVKKERMIGCIAIEKSSKDDQIYFIERLSVLPEERHQGYGKRLLDFAFNFIIKRGGKIVSIGIIDENKILKNWYLDYGFVEVSTKKFNHLPFTVCFLEKQVDYQKSGKRGNHMNYFTEINAAITVCDKKGIILYMNEKASDTYKNSGGKALIGTNLYDCHPADAKIKLADLMGNEKTNIYSIEKDGKRKLIYQTPWYKNKKFQGIIEMAFELPSEIPGFVRK
jgi:ribosomal protein S18 acetylase RimI-like enzyme